MSKPKIKNQSRHQSFKTKNNIVCSDPLKISKIKSPQGRQSVSNYVIHLFDRKVSGTNRINNLFAQNSLVLTLLAVISFSCLLKYKALYRCCYVCTRDSLTLTADTFVAVVECWLQCSALLLWYEQVTPNIYWWFGGWFDGKSWIVAK